MNTNGRSQRQGVARAHLLGESGARLTAPDVGRCELRRVDVIAYGRERSGMHRRTYARNQVPSQVLMMTRCCGGACCGGWFWWVQELCV